MPAIRENKCYRGCVYERQLVNLFSGVVTRAGRYINQHVLPLPFQRLPSVSDAAQGGEDVSGE